MRLLYSFGIRLYGSLIHVVSLFNSKAKKWVNGRKGWKQKLQEFSKNDHQKRIWFHTASLGEFEQARPLIEKIKEQDRGIQILLTFYSPSGFEIQKDYGYADLILYMPLDTSANAKIFLDLAQVNYIVFVKYEFWFNFFHEIKSRQLPFIMVSALFRDDQVFFKWFGGWFIKRLSSVSWFFLQDEHSSILLTRLGYLNHTISGDTRFDRVCEIAERPIEFPYIAKWKSNHKVLVSGSSWEKEDECLFKLMNEEQLEDWLFIIAPHEINEKKLFELEKQIKKVKTLRLSSVKGQINNDVKVLIVDSIGKLMHLYQFGDIALIGGGFHDGIHNTLEPAVFGMPVLFGPMFKKFVEAVELKRTGGGESFESYEKFREILLSWMTNDKELNKRKKAAKNYVSQNIGASTLIINESKSKRLLPE